MSAPRTATSGIQTRAFRCRAFVWRKINHEATGSLKMADPVQTLTPIFGAALARAFGSELEGPVDPALRPSAHADYQANVALGLAKKLRRSPRDVAKAIVEALASDE